jgi:HPt (histidine-containing phosphotransfer) domain-containing protein
VLFVESCKPARLGYDRGAAICTFFMTATSPEMDALHARYARSLASKHAALLEAWQAFAATHDDASARKLHDLVHRLAGSAPSYGYASLGLHAREADHVFTVGGPDLAERAAAPVEALLADLLQQARRAEGR